MKKIFLMATALVALMSASSCSTIKKTASEEPVNTEVASYSVADLEVSPTKITYFYKPSGSEQRGGAKNAVQCAVAEALKANGNADVLVAPQYVTKTKRGKVKEVTVTGYPAKYKNFHKPTCNQ